MQKIRRDDEVIVIAGKDKKKRGKVVRVLGDRLVVSGVNLVKKHVKPNPQVGEAGGVQSIESPIHVSNLAIYNPATQKADRVGFKILEDGTKVRVFKSNNEVIDR